MSAGRSVYLIVYSLLCSSEALENIPAVVGQDVTLPCKVNNNNNKPITAVEWSRPGLDPEYVFLYRDGHFDPKHQLPSYENRVDLRDREMKDGDVSMILKNVKMEDRGTYECFVFQGETNSKIIYLDVGPSGKAEKLIGNGGDKDGGDKDGGDKDGGDKVGGDKDGGDKDGGDKDGGVKVGGDKDGGDKDGGVKDGGVKDGGHKAEGHKDGGDKDGGDKVGIILGVVGLILLLVASVGFLIYRRHKRQNSNLPGEQML